jgi:hypothetical protein
MDAAAATDAANVSAAPGANAADHHLLSHRQRRHLHNTVIPMLHIILIAILATVVVCMVAAHG